MLEWIRERWQHAQAREKEKKKPRPKDTEREVLLFHGLWRELQDNRLDSVVSAAGRLLEKGSPSEVLEACKILGHAHLNRRHSAEAICYFRFIAEQENTPDAWFNLATAATQAQDFASSRQAYEQALYLCCEQHQLCHYSEPYMRMNFCSALYAQEELELAMQQLDFLLASYLHQASPAEEAAILSIQPSLPQLLTVASRILAHYEPERTEQWYADLAQGLDPRDRQLLARFHIHIQEPVVDPQADSSCI